MKNSNRKYKIAAIVIAVLMILGMVAPYLYDAFVGVGK